MTAVVTALGAFRDRPEPPKSASSNPFKLSSTLDEPASLVEIDQAWPGRQLPEQLEAWTTARQARLFTDVDYGQLGLVLLSPNESAQRTRKEQRVRPGQYRSGDVVIGRFLGDQEVVVLAAHEGGTARVLIALPLDDRSDWYVAAEDFGQFLASYFEHAGDTLWERRSGS